MVDCAPELFGPRAAWARPRLRAGRVLSPERPSLRAGGAEPASARGAPRRLAPPADNVHAVETEGTGLGLYLVRLIIERLAGEIWCESEEGRGSAFIFTLPISE
ncbi:MAG: hypothetical protein DMD87_12770 [Candidatus Rokuibacteriota bacterium]|nr:MAG: hypothetical protein DMD87_12770 [Candidatus Rokubacteria bacterium]